MTSRVVLVAVMASVVLADLAGQQTPPPQPTFRTRTDLVQVDASVKTCAPVVSIARPAGVAVRSVNVQMDDRQKPGAIDTTMALTGLLPGSYVLRVGCSVAEDPLTQQIGFIIKDPPSLH